MKTSYKICLVIVFNHRYDKNIPILRKIYGERFSTIRFLVPFYENKETNRMDGEVDNNLEVIPVYESSYQFQGFFAQAREQLLATDADYFLTIADDLLLNPGINEANVLSELSLEDGECLITEHYPMRTFHWEKERFKEAENCFRKQKHTNYQSEIIPLSQAYEVMKEKGFDNFKVREKERDAVLDLPVFKKTQYSAVRFLTRKIMKPYPLLAGYSDWFVMSRTDFETVSKKFGVTAAMGLFVEVAIPTMITLYCKKVKTFADIKYKNGAMWSGQELEELKQQHNNSISSLLENFPKEKLYLHPIKLSGWRE